MVPSAYWSPRGKAQMGRGWGGGQDTAPGGPRGCGQRPSWAPLSSPLPRSFQGAPTFLLGPPQLSRSRSEWLPPRPESIALCASTLGTLGCLRGLSGPPRSELRHVRTRRPGPSQHPGTQDVPQMPGRPRPALGHTDLWLSLERRVRAPCGQDRLRHCPLSSRPHVIVTFDLSQQPIGQGLGGRACGAGGKGPCPRRPLTKYRNGRGGGLRRRGCGGRVWRRRQGPPSSPGSVSFYFYSPDSGHILDGLRRGDGRDGVAPGMQPRLSLGQAAVGSQTGAPTPPVQLPPAPHGVWGVGTLPQGHLRPPSEHAAWRPRDRRGEQGSGRPQPGLCPVCAPLSDQAWLSRGCCWGTGQTGGRRNSPNRISTAGGPAGSPPATGAVPLPSAW